MQNPKPVLVLSILGTVALALGLAVWWPDAGLLDAGTEDEAPVGDTRPEDAGTITGDAGATTETKTEASKRIENREQIGSRSGPQHKVHLRFQCETLRGNVQWVWNFAKLRVVIEDEQGQHLAELQKPWKKQVLSLPTDARRIAVSAPGYKRKVVAAPPTFHKGQKPTTIVLEPDALVRVHVKGLPSLPGAKYTVSARLATGKNKDGKVRLQGYASRHRPTEVQRGTLDAEYKVPSGIACKFLLARNRRAKGDRDGFLSMPSKVVTLSPREERDITIDMDSFGVLEGRVTGVARTALKDRAITVRGGEGGGNHHGFFGEVGYGRVRGWEANGFGNFGNWSNNQIRLDSDGRFRIFGLSDKTVGLSLITNGSPWQVPLTEVGKDRERWKAGDVDFLVVEPKEAVFGIVPVRGGAPLNRPYRVQPRSPPNNRGLSLRVPLFNQKTLESQKLFFYVTDVGHFNRSLAKTVAGGDGLIRVEVPEDGGTLLISIGSRPEKGWSLSVQTAESQSSNTWNAIRGIVTDDGWRFEGLSAGKYSLIVRCYLRKKGRAINCSRRIPELVTVKTQAETKIKIQLPPLLVIEGEVTNWARIPKQLYPSNVSLSHSGQTRSARIANGRFVLNLMGPWEGIEKVTFSGRRLRPSVSSRDVIFHPGAEPRLEVLFPPNLRMLARTAKAKVGGRLWMQLFSPNTNSGWGHSVSPGKDGVFHFLDTPSGVDGILLEQKWSREAGTHRIVHGWFQIRPGAPEKATIELAGRWIDVSMAKPDGSTTLKIKPPSWWRHAGLNWLSYKVTGKKPLKLWLPADATGLVTGAGREYVASRIGDKLVIE